MGASERLKEPTGLWAHCLARGYLWESRGGRPGQYAGWGELPAKRDVSHCDERGDVSFILCVVCGLANFLRLGLSDFLRKKVVERLRVEEEKLRG